MGCIRVIVFFKEKLLIGSHTRRVDQRSRREAERLKKAARRQRRYDKRQAERDLKSRLSAGIQEGIVQYYQERRSHLDSIMKGDLTV